jgi:hypothetical protein
VSDSPRQPGVGRRRLTVAVRVNDRAASVLLVDCHRVAVALPDVVASCCFLERQAKIGDLTLVPEGDLARVSPNLIDQDPNAGLSRASERNAHCEGGGELHIACVGSCELV